MGLLGGKTKSPAAAAIAIRLACIMYVYVEVVAHTLDGVCHCSNRIELAHGFETFPIGFT